MATISLPILDGPPPAPDSGFTAGSAVTAATMIPDLLRVHPEARAVLDRYGLRGCGGRLGPFETLGFFARAHGVEQERLLRELAEAVGRGLPAGGLVEEPASVADAIYARFFLAGIVMVLSAGATWGAWLLWNIGLSGSFQANSLQSVNAHGMVQISGWVGLFIMGFAYQAFPRFWHTSLAAPRLAVAVFGAMIVGIATQAVGMVAMGDSSLAAIVATAGAGLQAAATAAFAAQILATFRGSGARFEPYVGFVTAALAWFVAATVLSGWHTWTTMAAPDEASLVWYVATYQAPLRDLQVHGLALFMILGVSIRMLPALFGAPRIEDRRAWTALGLLTAALLGEVALFLAYRLTGNHVLAAGLMLPWLMLAAGVALVVLPWRPWRPFPEHDRVCKFVRAAYGWLAVSIVMLALLPAYQAASGLPFSHAYYGAIRHAATVGFVSLMIMGFAAKAVPTLTGVDSRGLSSLWGPFLLVNAGCFLRVVTQTLTDWSPAPYAVIGVSGTMEVAGLAWWGFGIASLILSRRDGEARHDRVAAPAPDRIDGGRHPADVLDWFPETAPVFDRFGLTPLRSAALRRTIGRRVTLNQAARLHGISPEALTLALNDARR